MQSTNVPNVRRPKSSATRGVSLGRLGQPTPSTVQAMFLRRFQNLLEKRAEHSEQYPESDWRRRLIDKALYSTYRDCLDLELGEDVRELLKGGQEVPTP